MKYQHIYHAGNFADVAKHVALLYCLDALKRKDAGFFALDTHAGRGLYRLQAPEAQKSGEAERGVQRLVQSGVEEPALARYLTAIGAAHRTRLAHYPGSPALIGAALRPQDRALFVELLPAEARAAEREAAGVGRVRTEIGDGFAALRAHLPPIEHRGLVLIDPPYENVDEMKTVLREFADAHRRWPSGIFLIWYPILSAVQRRSVHARFDALRIPKILSADLAIHADETTLGLAGSGLMIVNPPYGADEYLLTAYEAIHRCLSPSGAGYVEVARLTPERMAQ